MARSRRWLSVLAIVAFLAACSSQPSSPPPSTPLAPNPTLLVTAPAPSASPAIGVDCGPLSAVDCTLAAAVAEQSLPGSNSPIRIVSPSATATCPPGGGPYPGTSRCDVIAIVTTATGEVPLGLIRNGTNWLWTGAIR
jgi:hypothetical protein